MPHRQVNGLRASLVGLGVGPAPGERHVMQRLIHRALSQLCDDHVERESRQAGEGQMGPGYRAGGWSSFQH